MRFRRKASQDDSAGAEVGPEPTPEAGAGSDGGGSDAAQADATPMSGPYDVADVDESVQRVDLGAILVPPVPNRELRLQVDEATRAVRAVLLTGPDGALEFQAFAAPRNGDLWSTVRPQIAADVANRGGTVEEREGRWGTELVCQVPVQRPDGTQATQPSRIIGVNGPRWLLRASLLGRPALDPENAGEWEDALAQIVVRRGTVAMQVGEPLPLRLPDEARRVDG